MIVRTVQAHRARLRRDQPGGHQRAALFTEVERCSRQPCSRPGVHHQSMHRDGAHGRADQRCAARSSPRSGIAMAAGRCRRARPSAAAAMSQERWPTTRAQAPTSRPGLNRSLQGLWKAHVPRGGYAGATKAAPGSERRAHGRPPHPHGRRHQHGLEHRVALAI